MFRYAQPDVLLLDEVRCRTVTGFYYMCLSALYQKSFCYQLFQVYQAARLLGLLVWMFVEYIVKLLVDKFLELLVYFVGLSM